MATSRDWSGTISDRVAGSVPGFIGANQDVNAGIAVVDASKSLPNNSMALLGDSITSQYTYEQVFSGSVQGGTSYNSIHAWANAFLGNRIQYVNCVDPSRNNAVNVQGWFTFGGSGQTSLDLLQNGSVKAVVAARPAYCALLIGTNDVMLLSDSAATIVNRIRTAVVTLQNAGITVVLCTVLPRGSGSGITNAQVTTMQAVNTGLRALAAADRNIVLCDWYHLMLDASAADGRALTSLTQAGTHPNGKAACLLGQYFASVVAPLFPNVYQPEQVGLVSLSQHLQSGTSGAFSGSGAGGGSGQVSTSWTCYLDTAMTCVASKVARTDNVPGFWQQLAYTGSNGGELRRTIAGTYVAGAQYVAVAEVQIDATNFALTHIGLNLQDNNAGNQQSLWMTAGSAVTLPSTIAGQSLMLVTAIPYTIPAAGATSLFISGRSEGGTHTVRWGRMQLLQVA